ncbi:MAG: patatin-like phospholipase family protein [Ignavibacteriales bacterium]|nr:patatin-like phospholipase family protein [Ignavibacteriales bacterium]
MSKLGLALGGGGARGLAHIGVLKVLDAEGIKPAAITGCSMGALVGGLYALHGNAKHVEEFILHIINNPKTLLMEIERLGNGEEHSHKGYFDQFFDYVGTRLKAINSLQALSYFNEAVAGEIFEMIPDVKIETLKIKFSAIATDLVSGEEINFEKGSLRTAIRASAAIPGIFPPVEWEQCLLVDGCASQSVPVGRVREIGADRVLAVDVTRALKIVEKPDNMIELLFRTEDITSYHLSAIRLQEADLIIRPWVQQWSWMDFDNAEEIIAAGEAATKGSLGEIKDLIGRNSLWLEAKQFMKRFKKN